MEDSNSYNNDEGGPVIEISKTCRTTPVEDGIVRINCAPLLYKLGLIRFFKNTSLWFVKDICGIVCAIFTWLLIVYAESVVMFIMLIPSPYPAYSMSNAILFNFFSFLAVASHLRAMFSDPGAVPKGNATRENIMKMGLKEGQVVYKCPKCISIKPERAHHCSVCQRCIRKMDHHCPWVNNCVGENNQKYFVLFTMYICLMSIHAIYMSVQHFIICLGKDWKECSGASAPATTVFLILLVFEGLLFGIFTAIMCGSQLSSICSDETNRLTEPASRKGNSSVETYAPLFITVVSLLVLVKFVSFSISCAVISQPSKDGYKENS